MSELKKVNNVRNFFSSLMFVLLSVFGGLTVGFGFGMIGTFIYLVILFPLIMGFIGGNIIIDSAKYTKTRNISLVITISVFTAVVLFGSMFYTRFLGFQITMAMQAFGGLSDESLKDAKVFVDYALEKETGYAGFVGYVLYKANQGVSIGKMFRSNALNLGPIFTWLYWLVELGVIVFITIYKGKEISKKLLCEFCNSWYTGKRHIGGIPAVREMDILNLINLKDYSSVGKTLEENADVPSMEFYLQSCPSCDKSISFLSATKVTRANGRLKFTDLLNNTLASHEKKLFVGEIKFLEN